MFKKKPIEFDNIDKQTLDPDTLDFVESVDTTSRKLIESLYCPKEFRSIFLSLLDNPDNILEKTAQLVDDKSVNQQNLDLFIKKFGELADLIQLPNNSDKPNSDRIIELSKELGQDEYRDIVDKLKNLL